MMMTDTPDAKLIAASLSDPIVAAMFAAYRHGAYESWQDALAVLALALLDRNKALEAALTRSMGGSTLLPTIFR
ncbi:MAG: hypothetical protein IMZ55_02400 [Acidobacteria bacterium]|nr:hypothetical protein [Acidobacteriota bacterium]